MHLVVSHDDDTVTADQCLGSSKFLVKHLGFSSFLWSRLRRCDYQLDVGYCYWWTEKIDQILTKELYIFNFKVIILFFILFFCGGVLKSTGTLNATRNNYSREIVKVLIVF